MIEKGTDDERTTPHAEIEHQQVDMVRTLLKAGADIQSQGSEAGMTVFALPNSNFVLRTIYNGIYGRKELSSRFEYSWQTSPQRNLADKRTDRNSLEGATLEQKMCLTSAALLISFPSSDKHSTWSLSFPFCLFPPLASRGSITLLLSTTSKHDRQPQ